jgi:hypothetical protein
MSDTVTFRPSIKKEELQTLVKRMHYNLNRFIDEAVKEKLVRESQPRGEAEILSEEIGKVVFEHMGWKFAAPTGEALKQLKKSVNQKALGKLKRYKLE